MLKKEPVQLDAHDYFSNATQAAMTIVEKVMGQHQCAPPDLNDLLYFCYVLLRLVLSRFDTKQREMLVSNLHEILKLASDNGKTMCQVIVSSKIDTEEERTQAMQTLVSRVGGNGTADNRLLLDVAKLTYSLGMVNDGPWKSNHHLTYKDALKNDVELKLNEFIDEKISEATQKGIKAEGDCPELTFFVASSINAGVMLGYVSILYHQSVDEMIDTAIKQITGDVSEEESTDGVGAASPLNRIRH